VPAFVPNIALDVDQSNIYPGSVPPAAGVDNTDYFGPDSQFNGATIFGTADGVYTVVVTDLASGCKEFLSIQLPFNASQAQSIVAIKDSEICPISIGDGTIEVTTDPATLAGFLQTDFTHFIISGTNVGNPGLGLDSLNTTLFPSMPPFIFSSLAPGVYALVSKNKITGCFSVPINAQVDSAAREPMLTPTIANNTTCTIGNGSISIIAAPGASDTAPLSGVSYSYFWTSTNPIIPGEMTTASLSALLPGNYTVTVTDDNTNCSITETYTILDQPYVPILNAITVEQNNTGCNAQADGEIKIINADLLLRNGVGPDIPGDVTEFEFDVYLNGTDPSDLVLSNVTTVPAATEISFANLDPGVYFVMARKITPGPGFDCYSAPVDADEILDLHTDPVLTSTKTANTVCDPLDPDGLMQVTADAASPLAGAYTFEWFTGSDTSSPFNNTAVSLGGDGIIASPAANIEEIQDVLHGQYTVRITNPKGCITIATYNVEYQPETPEILTFTTIDQDICAPSQNGGITISAITIGTPTDYDYSWYLGLNNLNVNTPIAGEVLPTISSNLLGGVYYVIATKKGGATGSGCPTPPVAIEIMDNTVTPNISFTSTANTNCSASNFDGLLNAVALTEGLAEPLGYTFEWFVGNGTVTPFIDPTHGSLVPLGGNVEEIQNIAPGDYTLRITDNSSNCQLMETFTLPDLPETPFVTVDPVNIQSQKGCFNSGSITITNADLLPLADVTQYNFSWSRGSDFSTAPIVFQADGGVGNGNILDNATYPSIGADIYWLVVTKLLGPGAECPATPVQIIIEDLSVDPTIAITPTANTACNLAFTDGSLTVNVTDASGLGVGANYDLNWLQFPVGSDPVNQIGVTGNQTFNNLGPGTYQLQATNNVTLCFNSLLVEIEDKPANPIVEEPSVTITPQINCDFDGSIVINEVLINSNPEPLNEFNFEWFRGTDFATATSVYGPVLGGAANGHTLDISSYVGISADTYWLLVTRIDGVTPGSSCQSSPIQLVVEDNTAIPVLDITEPGPQISCDPVNPNGSLSATADGTTVGFTFQWYSGDLTSIGNPLLEVPIVNGGNTATIFDVAAGQYALEATNAATGCSNSAIYTMSENLQLNKPRIQIVDLINAIDCKVPGAITISSVSNGIANNTYQWFFSSLATMPLRTDPLNPATEINTEFLNVGNYPIITEGTYFAVATDIGSQCDSDPFEVTLTDQQTDPVVSIKKGRTDSYCFIGVLQVGNGELIVSADGSNDITQYLFDWFDQDPIANPAAVPFVTNVNTATGLSSTITYYVRATDLNTNCSSVASQTVDPDIELDKPEILSNTKFDPIICSPFTAWIEITGVSTGVVTDHTFEWYRGIESLNNNPILSEITARLTNISPGNYFAIAISKTTGCRSLPYEIVIIDDNIILPDITITQSAPQTSCDPLNPNGQLSASVDGGITDTDPNYLFIWYGGFDTSGIPIDTVSTLSGISTGSYTVEVFSLISGCSDFESFTLENSTHLATPQVSPSFEPQTRCDVDNGSVQARVINITGNFSYQWYIGPSVKAVPGFTGASLTGIPPGVYTVTANNTITSCVSEPVSIEVTDERINPTISIVEDQPLINCDIARPNGQLSASVGETIGPYLFEWYNGTLTSGNPDFIGATYTNLAMGIYTVVVTDKNTLCSNQMQGEITDGRSFTPIPSPKIINNLTSCIGPNGEIQVSVDGEIFGFQFDWYFGTSISGLSNSISGSTV